MQAERPRLGMVTEQNRLLIVLVVFVIWAAITLIGGWIVTGGQGSLDNLVTQQIGPQFVLAPLFLLALVFAFRWQQPVGLKPAEPASSWRLLWLPTLFIIGFLASAVLFGLPPATVIIFALINTLLVGVSEELMFRGIIFFNLLSRFNVWPSILIATLLFGLVHSLNGFITGDFRAALIQAVLASLSGLWLIGIRLRTRSLYPAMLIHGLWDFAVFIFGAAAASRVAQSATAPAQGNLLQGVLFALPLALYGLWLLRNISKQTKDEVLA